MRGEGDAGTRYPETSIPGVFLLVDVIGLGVSVRDSMRSNRLLRMSRRMHVDAPIVRLHKKEHVGWISYARWMSNIPRPRTRPNK